MNTWIGLGSNLGNSRSLIVSALAELGIHPGIRVVRCSAMYRTSPWGVSEQPDFLNAVAELETTLSAQDTLTVLLKAESALGRTRKERRWGPRNIDIDLLLYGSEIYVLPELRVPHPRMHRRRFVLIPLAELEPDLVIPGRGTVAGCLRRLDRESSRDKHDVIEKLGP
ncbi:MAG: 2-amino-4-hydroxy-6-hydroxymethyldihydropteridine diphosphokinase [Xanthomonadales bacterium]|nr:2-amino-4-hydroxy-6-hydroxymethyldihydropteridine diphosphokinase [Gammaproteobacteria bacterium]NNE05464.1 2-amino-4-hydroxy-6-hydroxymethyldihydropteridine diphosphokinase [Xanthomonadales bacterium]NNL95490.1 2-amino-4-hydroxy-6-hydroxymethyldihydropteridine diphosphokinase [Xanthomonadales bacterium]